MEGDNVGLKTEWDIDGVVGMITVKMASREDGQRGDSVSGHGWSSHSMLAWSV